MKQILTGFVALLLTGSVLAQPADTKELQETARTFMRSGDWNNAILVLNRALQQDNKSLDMQKDLVMCYYYKKDYEKALEGIKTLIDRDDVDVMTFQIAGNIYKALEEAKDCEKLYKKALKKFPKSGPLYSEYGELLWAKNDFTAIDLWEKGIQEDPGYSGNYYNAAVFYFFTKDKVWSLVYGEIFVNMESLTERGAAMKKMVYDGYKEKLFQDADLLKGQEKNKNEFSLAYLNTMNKQSSLVAKGVNTEVLSMIRTRFILDWFQNHAARFPFRLFDYQQQLLKEGMFEAYNQWLFGTVENLAAYENWTKTHADEYNKFSYFQKNRVFKIPAGQYYSASTK